MCTLYQHLIFRNLKRGVFCHAASGECRCISVKEWPSLGISMGEKYVYRPHARVSWIAKGLGPQLGNMSSGRFIESLKGRALCTHDSVPLGPKGVNCFTFSLSKLN